MNEVPTLFSNGILEMTSSSLRSEDVASAPQGEGKAYCNGGGEEGRGGIGLERRQEG